MNEFFTKLQKEGRALKLSHDEKQSLRVRLYTYFERNNAPVEAPALAAAPRARSVSLYNWFSFQGVQMKWSAAIALVLVIGLSSGTAFAAQGALPGDPLYAVKINVNEAVQTALATTPVAKAQVNAAIATTRLEEAETLAASGKLTATTSSELASNFVQHADAAQANTDVVAVEDPGTAAQLGETFDSTLAAHGAILAQIGDTSSSTETMQSSQTLVAQVAAEQQGDDAVLATATTAGSASPDATNTPADAGPVAIQPSAAKVETLSVAVTNDASSSSSDAGTSSAPSAPEPAAINPQAAAQNSAEDAQIAASLSAQASTSIVAVFQDFASLQSSLDATTSAQIANQLGFIQTLAASGTAALAQGDASSAKDFFTRAARMAIKLDTYLKAGKKFNVSLLPSLLAIPPTGSRVLIHDKKDPAPDNAAVQPATVNSAEINASSTAPSLPSADDSATTSVSF